MEEVESTWHVAKENVFVIPCPNLLSFLGEEGNGTMLLSMDQAIFLGNREKLG